MANTPIERVAARPRCGILPWQTCHRVSHNRRGTGFCSMAATVESTNAQVALNLVAIRSLVGCLAPQTSWPSRINSIIRDRHPSVSLHLAVFIEPYLQYVLEGQKTVESRFSAVRCAPYGRVAPGDLILVKASGGPIVGVAEAGETWFYRLDPHSWVTIRREFTEALCAQDPAFWERRSEASYATLIRIARIQAVHPIPWRKTDRRGWVVLKEREDVLSVACHTLF